MLDKVLQGAAFSKDQEISNCPDSWRTVEKLQNIVGRVYDANT
jgi:hypothetical protein